MPCYSGLPRSQHDGEKGHLNEEGEKEKGGNWENQEEGVTPMPVPKNQDLR